MSMNANFHLSAREKGDLLVESFRQGLINGSPSAFLRVTKGMDTLAMFFDSVEDIERIATELSTLAMEIRMEGWERS